MKISTYIELMLVVGVIFFVFAMMINESAIQYPETNMTDNEMADKYDFSTQINNSFAPLSSAIQQVGNPDVGFFSKLASGLAAIPYAVILLPSVAIQTLAYGFTLLTGGFIALSVPVYILTVVFIIMLVWVVIKLIEVFQRWYI